jgi:hypothetical protein
VLTPAETMKVHLLEARIEWLRTETQDETIRRIARHNLDNRQIAEWDRWAMAKPDLPEDAS